jgi:guanosine-3',5'-bis(diphosphate) 3'-pyrophosphohydrolase
MSSVQTLYQTALRFASTKHTEAGQTSPGTNLPYIVHICNVAMEVMIAVHHSNHFNLELAIQVALLHDTLEDTTATPDELTNLFGEEVWQGVQALTKDDCLPDDQRMEDSLKRIRLRPKEIWAVKLADRITNLQSPPSHWDTNKKIIYQEEAMTILRELKGGNQYLANRLQDKIEEYSRYI